eukprot:6185545-Pleurochrysis_carterae.AAC.1
MHALEQGSTCPRTPYSLSLPGRQQDRPIVATPSTSPPAKHVRRAFYLKGKQRMALAMRQIISRTNRHLQSAAAARAWTLSKMKLAHRERRAASSS